MEPQILKKRGWTGCSEEGDRVHRIKHHSAAGHLSLFLSFAETLTRQLLI